MPSRSVVLLAAAATLLAGCIFQSLSPTQQLSDQVYQLNDETRWGRVDLAAQRVMPAYRQTFVLSRRSWGRDIALADTEVSALVLATDGNSATSTVEISWYDQRSMVLRGTVLRQRWAKTDAGFFLDEETVFAGDDTLLELPEAEEADGEAEPAPAEDATAGTYVNTRL